MLQRWIELGLLVARLRPGYVVAMGWYRRQCQRGVFEKRLPAQQVNEPKPLWSGAGTAAPASATPALRTAVIARADEILRGEFRTFTDTRVIEGEYPAWFKGVYAASAAQHFSRVEVNAVAGEDAQMTWDLSRFQWVTELALAASITQGKPRAAYLDRLYQLTTDWLVHNGYHRGVNWACAHEVSLRGMQLMLATWLLEQHVGLKPSEPLLALLRASFMRVEAVRGMSHAQQNMHTLSTEIFLLYAAAFLDHYASPVVSKRAIHRLQHDVQYWLQHCILPDGGVCSYATNDARLCADLVAFARLLATPYALDLFVQPDLQHRIGKLAAFLASIIEPVSGKIPLIGQHDGALLCPQYSAFVAAEPSLLLLTAAFQIPVPARCKRAAESVWLFGLQPVYTDDAAPVGEQHYDDFGLLIHTTETYHAYVKYPRHHFRPMQLDFLHLDLWVGGENVLTDSGSFSANPAMTIREGALDEASAHNVPLRMQQPLLTKERPWLYRYWPHARVKRAGMGAWDLWVDNGAAVVLHRRVMFEPRRIVLRDRVIDSQPWGIAMNGPIHESRGMMTMKLGTRCTVNFLNVQHVSISDTVRASGYQSLTPSFRLLAEPMVTVRPITTMIEVD